MAITLLSFLNIRAMKKIGLTFLILCFICMPGKKIYSQDNALRKLFTSYYDDRLKLFPFEATEAGDPRYNDLLPNNGSQEYIKKLNSFYRSYLNTLKKYNREKLIATDRTSYDLLQYILENGLEAQSFHPEYIPLNQMSSV